MNVGVGKYVYQALTAIEGLTVFPVIADFNDPQSTTPFAVYQRTSCTPEYTKDIYTGGMVHSYSVTIADTDYTNTVTIAEQAINAIMALSSQEKTDLRFRQVMLTDISEDFIDGIYTQTLQFEINTTSK